MKIQVLKSTFTDNYFYLLSSQSEALLIDPIDSQTAIEAVNAAGLSLRYVVNTHFHPDHVGGDDAVLGHFTDAKLVAPRDEVERVKEYVSSDIDRTIAGGDTLSLGDESLEVIDTPGHTLGHISLQFQSALFSGDTIFAAGAGHCRFGGDPGVFFHTYDNVLSALPDETVFHPGHNYALHNLAFALSLQPKFGPAQEAVAMFEAAEGLLLTTLGQERRFNPFFRYQDPDLVAALRQSHSRAYEEELAASKSDDEAVFRLIRRLRNSW